MLQSKVFGKILWRKLRFRRSLLFARIQFSSVGRWKGVGWGWALIRAWALIRDWALIRINTVNWSDANAVIIIFNYENLLYVSFFIPRFKYMKFIYSSSHCSLLVEIMRHYLAQNARCRWASEPARFDISTLEAKLIPPNKPYSTLTLRRVIKSNWTGREV